MIAIAAGVVVLGTDARCGTTSPELVAAWTLSEELSFTDAARAFAQIAEEQPELKREADYGRALALLNAPPKTESRITEARLLLEQVCAIDQRDELGQAAGYFIGRIYQNHQIGTPDYEQAMAWYRNIGDAGEGSWYGQAALVKLALLELTFGTEPGSREAKLSEWERRADTITEPVFRRYLDRILTWACLMNDLGPARALPHARHAADLGYSRGDLQSYALTRVCLLAMDLGETAIAKDAAQRFLDAFPQHYYRPLMRDYLHQLEQSEGLRP